MKQLGGIAFLMMVFSILVSAVMPRSANAVESWFIGERKGAIVREVCRSGTSRAQ